MNRNEVSTNNLTPEAARAEVEFLLKAGMTAQKEIDDANKRAEKPEVMEIAGETYIRTGTRLERHEPKKPDKEVRPDVFRTFSLDGLIEFIRTDVDGYFQDESRKCIVQVSSPTTVKVLTPITGYWQERIPLAVCEATVPTIHFDCYMEQDEFQTMIQANFKQTEESQIVLQVVGSLRKVQKVEKADDGVSQRLTINAGVSTAENITWKNPVPLVPIRTFQEIEQPESPFVLRANEEAQAALFEGDGGKWQLMAVSRVTKYLRDNLMDCNVVVID